MEEVSDSEDAGKSSDESEDVSEIDSDEDLRLTSTDEEKEKVKKEKRKPRDDPERVRARKQRELRREILRWVLLANLRIKCQNFSTRAERIAAREKLAARRSPLRKREGRGDGWEQDR